MPFYQGHSVPASHYYCKCCCSVLHDLGVSCGTLSSHDAADLKTTVSLICGQQTELACDLVNVETKLKRTVDIVADAIDLTIFARLCSSDMVRFILSAMVATVCFPTKTEWHDTSGRACAIVKSSSPSMHVVLLHVGYVKQDKLQLIAFYHGV